MSILSSTKSGKDNIMKEIAHDLLKWHLVHFKGIRLFKTKLIMSKCIKTICDVHNISYEPSSSFIIDIKEATKERSIKEHTIDCAAMHNRYDVIGFYKALSLESKEQKKSVIVFENITDLEPNLYDLLLYSWSKEKIQISDDRPGQNGEQITIVPSEYLVYMICDVEKDDDLIKTWKSKEGFTILGDYDTWKENIEATYETMGYKELKKLKEKIDKL